MYTRMLTATGHCGMQTDMVLEKELRVLHFDMQAKVISIKRPSYFTKQLPYTRSVQSPRRLDAGGKQGKQPLSSTVMVI
ncbi:hypothetical protein STEG23_003910 [Scotinomys teguina]